MTEQRPNPEDMDVTQEEGYDVVNRTRALIANYGGDSPILSSVSRTYQLLQKYPTRQNYEELMKEIRLVEGLEDAV
jgi:hypothetical protein